VNYSKGTAQMMLATETILAKKIKEIAQPVHLLFRKRDHRLDTDVPRQQQKAVLQHHDMALGFAHATNLGVDSPWLRPFSVLGVGD
jgi:hypothetical protein